MAAPTPTARGTPAGIKLEDGYQTLITFASHPTIKFWEKTVKPPGLDGGDGIDTTTMHNVTYRTFDTKHLKTLTESVLTGPYDPDVFTTLVAQININQACTTKFPDGSTLTYYGAITKAEIGEHKEGELPEMTITIKPTNWDPTGFVEAAPVFTAATGT